MEKLFKVLLMLCNAQSALQQAEQRGNVDAALQLAHVNRLQTAFDAAGGMVFIRQNVGMWESLMSAAYHGADRQRLLRLLFIFLQGSVN